VLAIVAGIIVILSAIAFGFQPMFRDRIGQSFVVRHGFPGPAVIPDERAQRERLDAEQLRDLNGAHGRMPIDAAMKAIAAKGAHAFDPVGGG
jgi:hypothetical protein